MTNNTGTGRPGGASHGGPSHDPLTVPVAEQELNAAILADPGLYARICDIVTWADVDDPLQRRVARAIWMCVQDAQEQTPPIPASRAITYGAIQTFDPGVTQDVLRALDDLATENVLAQVGHLAQVIRQMAQARRSRRALQQALTDVQQRPGDLTSVLAGVQARLGDIQMPVGARTEKSLRVAMDTRTTDQPVAGIPTGFALLDHPRLMGGLKPGRILLIPGREKGRKSTVAQQVCLRQVLNQVQGTYYTLDGVWFDIRDSLLAKLATAILRRMEPDPHDLTLKGDALHPEFLTDRQNDALQQARDRLAHGSHALWIMDKADGISDIDVLEREIRRGVRDRGDRYIIIDYVQDIQASHTRNERETLNYVIGRLDVLCRSLGVASIWISQRSDDNNRRAADDIARNTMPQTVGTKESKKVSEAADYILLVDYDQINQPDWIRVGFWGGRHVGATPWHAMPINPSSGLILYPMHVPDWVTNQT